MDMKHRLSAALLVILLLMGTGPGPAAAADDEPAAAAGASTAGDTAALIGTADGAAPLLVKREFIVITYDQTGVIDVLGLVTLANPGVEPVAAVGLAVADGALLIEAEAADGGGQFSQEGGGLLIDKEILPAGAERSYRVQYRIPAARLPVTLVRPILYPTEQLTVMTPDDVLVVWSEDFVDEGVTMVAETPMRALVSRERQPVDEWRIGLMPAGGTRYDPALPVHGPRQGVTGFFWAALGAMAAVAAGSLWARRRDDGGGGP